MISKSSDYVYFKLTREFKMNSNSRYMEKETIVYRAQQRAACTLLCPLFNTSEPGKANVVTTRCGTAQKGNNYRESFDFTYFSIDHNSIQTDHVSFQISDYAFACLAHMG